LNKDKLSYAILKEMSGGNSALTEAAFQVGEEDFDEAVNFLTHEGYLIGVYWADDRPQLDAIGPALTNKGETYLKENSLLAKTYKNLNS